MGRRHPPLCLWARKSASCLQKSSNWVEKVESSKRVIPAPKGRGEIVLLSFIGKMHKRNHQCLFVLQEKEPHVCSVSQENIFAGQGASLMNSGHIFCSEGRGVVELAGAVCLFPFDWPAAIVLSDSMRLGYDAIFRGLFLPPPGQGSECRRSHNFSVLGSCSNITCSPGGDINPVETGVPRIFKARAKGRAPNDLGLNIACYLK